VLDLKKLIDWLSIQVPTIRFLDPTEEDTDLSCRIMQLHGLGLALDGAFDQPVFMFSLIGRQFDGIGADVVAGHIDKVILDADCPHIEWGSICVEVDRLDSGPSPDPQDDDAGRVTYSCAYRTLMENS
jgi:hypothetical protein